MISDHGLPRNKNHGIRKTETDFNTIYVFNSRRRYRRSIRRRMKPDEDALQTLYRMTVTGKTSWVNLIHQTNLIRFIRRTTVAFP
jgi:hypothetical protein